MDSLLSTFHIDVSLLIAQAVNFALVFAALYFIAVKPLRKLVANRTEEITKGLTDAEENKTLLEASKAEHKAMIVAAQKEAQAIVEAAKASAREEGKMLIEQAQAAGAEALVRGKADLAAERNKMLAEAKSELADMIVSATERVLEDMPVKGIDRALVDKALAKK
jgi:F-type H+-transporting ATPase subunit b